MILCVDTDWVGVGYNDDGTTFDVPWYDNVVGASVTYNAPLNGTCWNGNNDFLIIILSVDGTGNAMTVAYCADLVMLLVLLQVAQIYSFRNMLEGSSNNKYLEIYNASNEV